MAKLQPVEDNPTFDDEPTFEDEPSKLERASASAGRIIERAKRGANNALRPDDPLGLDEAPLAFQNDYFDPLRHAANQLIVAPTQIGDAIFRALYAPVTTFAATAGAVNDEVVGDGMGGRLERDILALADSAAIVTGGAPGRMRSTSAPRNTPQAPSSAGAGLAAEKLLDPAVREAQRMQAPQPNFAGNINLDKIYAAEDAKDAIRTAATENKDFIAARRGVISQDQTREMASLVGMDEAKLATRIKGQAFNAEEMFAARELLVAQATKVRDLAKTAKGGSDDAKLAFDEAMHRLVTIQEQVSGATAEAGRTLQQFRMVAGASKEEIAALVNSAKSNRGLDDIIDKVASLDDPAQVATLARKAFDPTWGDKIFEVWINGLLSGPQTHAANMLSNSITALWSVPESAVAATISKATGSGISGQEAIGRVFGILEGAPEGIRAGWRAFQTETPSSTATKIEAGKQAAIPGAVGKALRTPGRALMLEDEFFKAIGYRQQINAAVYRLAKNEGLSGKAMADRVSVLRSNPTDEMITAAKDSAAKQTFTNPLGDAGNAVTMLTRKMPGGRFIVPFVRTPINIVKFAAERSPFAPLFKETREKLQGKKGAAVRDEEIAKIALGSTVSASAGYLASQGLITGSGPSDPAKRALLYQSGWQPNSVKIGDTFYSFSRLEPFGMLMGVAADAVELSDAMTDDEADNIAALVMGSVSKNLVSKTWLSGPADLIEAVQDPERYGANYVKKQAGSIIPAIVAQAARANDPYMREARTMLDTIRSRVPGEREKLFLKRDAYGDPIVQDAAGPNMVSPIYQSAAKNDPAIAEMLRLDVAPGKLRRQMNGVELSDEEFDRYAVLAGTLTKTSLAAIVNQPGYANAPDEAKAEVMRSAIRMSRDLARDQMLTRYPDLALRIAAEKSNPRK